MTKTKYTYIVAVEPVVTVYAGTWRGSKYTVEVYAATAAEAIKLARRQRRDEDGRHAVAARYTAKRAAGALYTNDSGDARWEL